MDKFGYFECVVCGKQENAADVSTTLAETQTCRYCAEGLDTLDYDCNDCGKACSVDTVQPGASALAVCNLCHTKRFPTMWGT